MPSGTPLVAGLDSERPAVRVWDCGAGKLHELGTVGADSAVYGDASGWRRMKRTPAAAWHPDQPLLLVAGEGGVVRWTPAGFSELEGFPPTAAYRSLAFSPDGHTLWHRHRQAMRATHGSPLMPSTSRREPPVSAAAGTPGLRRIRQAGWWPRSAAIKVRRSDSSHGSIKRTRPLPCECFARR